MEEMGVTAIDPRKYGRLCADAVPRVIRTNAEFDRMGQKMEELDRKEKPSPEEEALSELLARLIDDYDEQVALPGPDIEPYQVVLHLMEQKQLRQADLLPIFGSRSVASAVLGGKRELSKAHIRGLAEFFHISPSAFF
jgi:HTH-type transcriptional regulator / antitoxin HigA